VGGLHYLPVGYKKNSLGYVVKIEDISGVQLSQIRGVRGGKRRMNAPVRGQHWPSRGAAERRQMQGSRGSALEFQNASATAAGPVAGGKKDKKRLGLLQEP